MTVAGAVGYNGAMDAEPETTEIPVAAYNPTPALRFDGPPECVAELVAKLAEARTEFTEVKKARQGQMGHQKFLYSPLGVLTDASMIHLNKRGIFVAQPITESPTPGKQRLTLMILGHGARITSWVDFVPVQEIKEYGKDTTYRRRYQYNSFFVLDGEPDADEAAKLREETTTTNAKKPPPDKRSMTEGQAGAIGSMLAKLRVPTESRDSHVAQILGNDKPRKEYTVADGSKVIEALKAQIEGKGKGK